MITNSIDVIKDALLRGEVIGLPTETVYGLAANAFDENAIQSIFIKKGRPLTNPLIVHIGDQKWLSHLTTEVPPLANELISRFWPGPLTIILRKKNTVSDLVTAGQDTVALRMPAHEKCRELLNQLPFPLVAPSANPYMSVSSTSALHVDSYFPDIKTLDGGNCQSGIESTIVGVTDNRIQVYRLGSITIEALEMVAKCELFNTKQTKVHTPGMALRHYSPVTPLIYSSDIHSEIIRLKSMKIGVALLKEESMPFPLAEVRFLSKDGDLEEVARNIYAILIELDNLGLDVILVEKSGTSGIGRAIQDRMNRAQLKSN